MAELARRNVLELIDAVGSLIDISPTDSTTPSRAQVVDWINEGAVQVFRLVPIGELNDAHVTDSLYGYSISSTSLTNKLFRIVSVERNDVECIKVTTKDLSDSKKIDPMRFSGYDPAYTIRRIGGVATIEVMPRESAYLSTTYVPYPFVYVIPEDDEDAEDPTALAVPSVLEEMVIEYAALKYRIQDEEPAQYKMYVEDWMNKIKLFYSLPSEQIEGV